MKTFIKRVRVLLAAPVTLAVTAMPVLAGVDFHGKQITIVIGYGMGGTYGQYSRLFSNHLKKYLPGTPSMVVQSMPGAGGLKMINYAANVMPADGSYIFVPPDTMVVLQLLQPDSVKFDARKFHYIGTSEQTNVIWVVRKDAARSLEDLKTKEVISGHSGPGSTGFLIPAAARSLLGLKVKLIGGYEGSRKTILAMEQGEIQGAAFGWSTWDIGVPHWFAPGKEFAVPILQVGAKPDPDVPNVPMLNSLVAKENVPIVNFLGTLGLLGRGLALPPAGSGELTTAFRATFDKMIKDTAYVADAKKQNLRVNPTSGAELEKAIKDVIDNSNDAVLAKARKVIYAKQ